MNKKDFLTALSNGLKDLPPDKVSDILFDYQDYFNSKKDLMTEEEMILSLGEIDNLIEKYKEEYSDHPIKHRKFENTTKFKDFTLSSSKINNSTKSTQEEFFKEEANEFRDEFFEEDNIHTSSENNSNNNFNSNNKFTDTINPNKKYKKKYGIKNPFRKFKPTTFIGALFSLPLIVIAIPISIALTFTVSSIYVAFVVALIAIALLFFSISLIPLAISFGGLALSMGKTLSPLFFTDIPDFLLEFPTLFIILMSLSTLCLFICMFGLSLSYFRFAKNKIAYITKGILKILFYKGEIYEAS